MSLPSADRAVIEPSKIRDYLLSSNHPVGRFKARVFVALGYNNEHWEVLRDDLLDLARAGQTTAGQPSQFGQKFEVEGTLIGPSGRSAVFSTVWIVDVDAPAPRFVTAFPR